MSDGERGFQEDGYRITWDPDSRMLREAHALRAEVFCRELRWVGSPSHGFERDAFDDEHATSVVVLDHASAVVGTVRLVPGNRPWMLDGTFRDLVPDHVPLRRRGSMEASRLAVERNRRAVRLDNGRRIADLLFKAAWVVCNERGIRRLYLVTSRPVSRRLAQAGLPCTPLAPPTRMPDGVEAVPLVLDWDRLRVDARIRAWFEGGTAVDRAASRLRGGSRAPPPANPLARPEGDGVPGHPTTTRDEASTCRM